MTFFLVREAEQQDEFLEQKHQRNGFSFVLGADGLLGEVRVLRGVHKVL